MGGVTLPDDVEAITVEPESKEDIFIFLPAFIPFSENHTFNFTVTKDGKEYVATLSISKSMEAGQFYTANIELEEIPYVTFTADAAQKLSYGGRDLQYSKDGTTFVKLEANDEIDFGGNTKLYLRGENNLDGTVYYDGDKQKSYKITFKNDDVPVACTGDIRTLIDYKTYKTVDTSEAQFIALFSYSPALTSAPKLPATTLAEYCYYEMFEYCTSLEKAPELPAETLAKGCYEAMFNGCTKLSNIKMLATDISATDCLKDWVKGVAATGEFTKASTMTSLPTGDSGIPAGWTIDNQ